MIYYIYENKNNILYRYIIKKYIFSMQVILKKKQIRLVLDISFMNLNKWYIKFSLKLKHTRYIKLSTNINSFTINLCKK